MVKPPDILLEQDCTNDDVVEACSYGALNLKPENTSTKVLDYDYKVFLGYSCNVSKGRWMANFGEAAKPGIFVPKLGCDWDQLGSLLSNDIRAYRWKNFQYVSGKPSTNGDQYLTLV